MPLMSFKKRYIEPILRGEKTFTLRTTARCKSGDVLTAMCRWGDPPFAHLEVLAVEEIALGELTDDDARGDGHEDLAQMRESWDTLYPNSPWHPRRRVSRIRFRLV